MYWELLQQQDLGVTANEPAYCCNNIWMLLQENMAATTATEAGCYRIWALLQKDLTTAATESGSYCPKPVLVLQQELAVTEPGFCCKDTGLLLQQSLAVTVKNLYSCNRSWQLHNLGLLLQKKQGVPCFRVGLALQHAEVLEEELHALAGLLHNGAVDTGHARLQCQHPTLNTHSCIAFAYATRTCTCRCSRFMHYQHV